jgi:hypothetical protein
MKRGPLDELAFYVVVYMKNAKHNEDALYIDDLERMLCDRDEGHIWQCEAKHCNRYCEYDPDNPDEDSDPEWQCHCCFSYARPSGRYCVICMPKPFPLCAKCHRAYCPDCACGMDFERRYCEDCPPYDEEDLAALKPDFL